MGIALPRIGRWLVSQRAIAGDEHALAWSDALAARTLRDLVQLAITFGALASIVAFATLGLAAPASWDTFTDAWIGIVGPVGMAALVGLAVVATYGQPERHVQSTLWPQFAADAT